MEPKLKVDFAKVVSELERVMKKFKLKRILYRTIFRGKGLEFDRYRDFNPDEDASSIDWKASLKANTLLARQYIEERDLDFYFVVDVSNSMMFGSSDKLKAEYAAEIVAALGHLILNSNDNVGLIMWTDNAVKVIPPSNSRNQLYLMNSCLSDLTLYGGNFNFQNMVEFLLRLIKSSSVIIFVSDFIHLNKSCGEPLKVLSAKFETIAIMVRDLLDEGLPANLSPLVLEDPYSRNQILVDPKIASERYSISTLRQKHLVEKLFLDSNIDLLGLTTNESPVVPLVSFLKQRTSRR
ncbi:DUF58 domain-containing protein [Candidatus Pacearchaeota archaeon]|nr:DUF58 domain-containing protein [Candidatus Pacearchaeota archaeon]